MFFCVSNGNLTEYERDKQKYLEQKEKMRQDGYEFSKAVVPASALPAQYEI
jgi:hypothetical protein